jgi:hypothetical protein
MPQARAVKQKRKESSSLDSSSSSSEESSSPQVACSSKTRQKSKLKPIAKSKHTNPPTVKGNQQQTKRRKRTAAVPTMTATELDSEIQGLETANTNVNYTSSLKKWIAFCKIHVIDPNEVTTDTPRHIKWCMTQFIFMAGIKAGSADTLKSALVRHFKQLDMIYNGPWTVHPNMSCSGNPAESSYVKEFVSELKGRDSEASRSQPMSYPDCEKTRAWLLSDESKALVNEFQREQFMMAMSCGFTLWLRNDDENLSLRWKDVEMNQIDASGSLYHRFHVPERKHPGQQNGIDDSQVDDRFKGYEIYPQPDQPATCLFEAIIRWKGYLTKKFKHICDDEVPIYPHVSCPEKNQEKGKVTLSKRMDGGTFQSILDTVVTGAGLSGYRRTGHCFRRGGAQDRYIHQKHPWNLQVVKWWGGWSKGETEDTILKYLLNLEGAATSYYGDMLNPSRKDSRHVVRGEESDDEERPLTQRDLKIAQVFNGFS